MFVQSIQKKHPGRSDKLKHLIGFMKPGVAYSPEALTAAAGYATHKNLLISMHSLRKRKYYFEYSYGDHRKITSITMVNKPAVSFDFTNDLDGLSVSCQSLSMCRGGGCYRKSICPMVQAYVEKLKGEIENETRNQGQLGNSF
jgi:hypothetical protein